MTKYMVRLKENYSEEAKAELEKEAIEVIYVTKLIPNFIIVETSKDLKELQEHSLIKSAEEPPIGSIDV